jgi:hypothetical protein
VFFNLQIVEDYYIYLFLDLSESFVDMREVKSECSFLFFIFYLYFILFIFIYLKIK